MYPYNYGNQNMLNQLQRQKESVESMINQYNQMQNQPPIQNIINQGSNLEFEARILNNGEDISNIGITRRTLFLDETNKKVSIKEIDGTISKEYEIIIPLDEKDKKILDLENKLKEMEDKIKGFTKSNKTINDGEESDRNANRDDEPAAKSTSKAVSKSAKWKTSWDVSSAM